MSLIAISGSTGFVGSNLTASLKKEGHQIIPLTRADFRKDAQEMASEIKGAEVLIHLAGAPIIKRWSKSYKDEIYHSRVDTTHLLVEAMKKMREKPSLFISTSAIGVYEDGQEHTEESSAFSEDFMGIVCNDWEANARLAPPEVRTVIFRLGMVLGRDGGALKTMLPIFKAGLGGKIGSGKQGFSWIHLHDLINAYHFVMEKESLKGVVNLTAPQPVSNKEFTRQLAKTLNRPAIFPVPESGLKIVYGEGAQALTSGAFVRPKRLNQESFKFEYPTLPKALQDLLK